MREQFPPPRINFASVDIVGWPGLALVAIVVAIAMEFPETRVLLLSSAAAGAALAAALIWFRAHHA
jgi:hypothetical protein